MKINKLNSGELEIGLSLARALGSMKFFSMLRASRSLDEVLKYLTNGKKVYSLQDTQRKINSVEKIGAKIIPACDPNYHDILRNIPGYQPVITALGDVSLLSCEIITIIGGRNSSVNGRIFASKLAFDLSKAGFIVVSWLTRGIDTAANRATLYRWMRKKATGESLKPVENGCFIGKIDTKMLAEYVKKHQDHTLMEMKQNLGFWISSIWYKLSSGKLL